MRQTQRYLLTLTVMLISACITTACIDDDPVENETETPTPPSDEGDDETGGEETPTPPDDEKGNNENNNENGEENTMSRNIIITVGNASFSATLADNETARAFAAMLPMTIQMSDLNDNEKYHYLSNSLPVSSYQPGTIHTGDLMLYGSTCVVLFYETFSSGYSYTRLGHIVNPEGLSEALGNGDISVKFEMRQ